MRHKTRRLQGASTVENKPRKFEIVCSIAARDMQVYNHLMPIAILPVVSHLWIVRFEAAHKTPPKSNYVIAASRFRPVRWIQYLGHCLRLGRRKEVIAFVNFNPLPYGLIALLAGWVCRKPVHLGFIGSDWFKFAKHGWGRPFLPLLRRADFYTVTGEIMRREMVEFGFDADRIHVLMHSIDLEAFQINDPDQAAFDFIFVGQLIPRKRVDTIIDAFAEVTKSRPDARLCILGGGPLEQELIRQVDRLGIAHAVTLAGMVEEVPPWIHNSRVLVMASDYEGFPFAMVEAMCCGLPPITTPVGTVGDFINHGENGMLFPIGDSRALARLMLLVLEDPPVYQRLRKNALIIRERFDYATASELWEDWFRKIRSTEG